MSGTDSKAGGPDYLLLHMQAKQHLKHYKNYSCNARRWIITLTCEEIEGGNNDSN